MAEQTSDLQPAQIQEEKDMNQMLQAMIMMPRLMSREQQHQNIWH